MSLITIIRNGETITLDAEASAAFEAARTPPLDDAQQAARAQIRLLREQAERTFEHAGLQYDAREAGRIAMLANAARTSPDSFVTTVIALDESETVLSASEYLDHEAALIVHLLGCGERSDTLRQAVAAAADHAALAAIDLEAGWP